MKHSDFFKIISLLLVLVMLAGALAACQNGEGDGTVIVTGAPTLEPTDTPDATPTEVPTGEGSENPTEVPTDAPTQPGETKGDDPVVEPTDPKNLHVGTWKFSADLAPSLLESMASELSSMGIQVPEKIDPIVFTAYLDFAPDGVMKLFADDAENASIGSAIAVFYVKMMKDAGYLAMMLALSGQTEEQFLASMTEEFNAEFSSEVLNTKGFYALFADGKMLMIAEKAEDLCEKDGFIFTVTEKEMTVSRFISGGVDSEMFLDMIPLPAVLERCSKEVPEIADRPDDPPESAAAKIGTVYYETLNAAFAEAKAGDTVEILRDIVTSDPIVVPAIDGELNVNGCFCTITSYIAGAPFITLTGGKLNVSNLEIIYTETTNSADGFGAFKVPNNSALVLDWVDITAKCNNALYVSGTGVITIEQGTITVTENNGVAYSNVFDVRSGGTLVINDGSFARNNTSIIRALIRLDKGAHVEINGGTFYSATGRIIFTNGNDSGSSLKSFVINDGQFEAGCAFAIGDPMFVLGNNCSGQINGGFFFTNDGAKCLLDDAEVAIPLFKFSHKAAELTITGGIFNSRAAMIAIKTGILSMTGGSLSDSTAFLMELKGYDAASASVTITNGEIHYFGEEDKNRIIACIAEGASYEDVGYALKIGEGGEPSGDLPVFDPAFPAEPEKILGTWRLSSDVSGMIAEEFAAEGMEIPVSGPVYFNLYFHFGEDGKMTTFVIDGENDELIAYAAQASLEAMRSAFGPEAFAAYLAMQQMTEDDFLTYMKDEVGAQFSPAALNGVQYYQVVGNMIMMADSADALSEASGVLYSAVDNTTLTLSAYVEDGISYPSFGGMFALPVVCERSGQVPPVIEEDPDGYLTARTMSDKFVYERTDYDALRKQVQSLTAAIKAGTESVENIGEAYHQLEDAVNRSYTMESLISIRQSEDVGDEAIAAESLWISEQSSRLFVDLVALDVAAYESEKYRDVTLGEMTEEDIRYLEVMKKLADDEYVALSTEEADLENRYLAAEATVTVRIGGRDYTLEELTNAGLTAKYGSLWEDAYVDAVGKILIEMVRVRNQIAKKAGFDNYADYAYAIVYERGYTPADAATFADSVKAIFPYLLSNIVKSLSQADISFINGSYYRMPGYDLSDYTEIYREYFASISPEMEQNFEQFLEDGPYSLGDEFSRQQGAFTTYLSSYDTPFIFMYTLGGPYDTTTLIHEFGHYNAFAIHGDDLASDLDICELHSQMDEILFLPMWDKIVDESKAKAIAAFEIYTMTQNVLAGCQEDEFQREIYANPEKYGTVAALNSLYGELNSKYYIGSDNTGWASIHHTFEVPFYYISYATSAVPAMELFVLADKDYATAVKLYNKLVGVGTEYDFEELIEYVSLGSPFSVDTIVALVNGVIAALAN